MTITDRIKRFLAPPTQPVAKAKDPASYVTGGGSEKRYFQSNDFRSKLPEYRNMYDRGGMVSQAVDCYPLYMLAAGYRLEGEDEAAIEKVQEVLDRADFDDLLWQSVVDALVTGDGYQEITRLRDGTPYGLVARDAATFSITYDSYGNITEYVQSQTINGQKYEAVIKPENMVHVTLKRSAGRIYGDSLIGQAYDDIVRDTTILDGSTRALKRHAWPKFHVRVGSDTRVPSEQEIDDINREFVDIDAKSEFTTTSDVDIKALDSGGVANLESYNNVSVMRLCSSLGVPGELLNYRQGTTDNTAVARTTAFFKKISTFQKRLANAYNTQFIDQITGEPGVVVLVFNDAAPDDVASKVQWINTLLKVDSLDPWAVITRDQVYGFLDWNIEDYKPEEMPEADQPAEVPEQLMPFAGAGAEEKADKEDEVVDEADDEEKA